MKNRKYCSIKLTQPQNLNLSRGSENRIKIQYGRVILHIYIVYISDCIFKLYMYTHKRYIYSQNHLSILITDKSELDQMNCG